jgi:hypothetical protein
MGAQPAGQPPFGGSGGSFLGTAAASAVGVIGSSLLLDGIRSMMGRHASGGGGGHSAASPPSGSSSSTPWGNPSEPGSGGGGDLSRQAGIDDIGRGSGSRDDAGADRGHGLADTDAAKTSDDGRFAADPTEEPHPGEGQDGRYAATGDDDDDLDLDDNDFGDDSDDDQ